MEFKIEQFDYTNDKWYHINCFSVEECVDAILFRHPYEAFKVEIKIDEQHGTIVWLDCSYLEEFPKSFYIRFFKEIINRVNNNDNSLCSQE